MKDLIQYHAHAKFHNYHLANSKFITGSPFCHIPGYLISKGPGWLGLKDTHDKILSIKDVDEEENQLFGKLNNTQNCKTLDEKKFFRLDFLDRISTTPLNLIWVKGNCTLVLVFP